ncbi:hypothetical protein V7S43_015542 [Phytophthora oleae]|uniref:Uncharacterized protein n=1 Tax=Phytophthora oleae TaxID=2107226 RepID=A0ABD3F0E3_9STRA
MDGSFISPPFPFPEAWPRIFAEQQQRQERRWLTPTTFGAVRWPVPVATEHYYPTDPIAATDVQVEDDDEKASEYEYGYVLSDEWRERFQSSIQLQQHQPQQEQLSARRSNKRCKMKIKQKKKTANAEAVAAASASRSGHLQREIQAAKTRELARKWKRRGGSNTVALGPKVTALETSLNAQFDEFCDVFQPVVWPHDPL